MNSLIPYCTKCKKPLTGMKYNISLHIEVQKEKESGAWESLENLDVTSHELLCDDCFTAFTNKIKEINNV